MWRKEQHFITTQKHSTGTHLLDNGGTMGPWCENRTSMRTPSIDCRQADCYDGCRMYGGHEFDIFGNSNLTILSNDDDEQWHSIRHSDSTLTNPSTTVDESQISSSAQITRTPLRHHYYSIETSAVKRKAHQDGRSALGMVEKMNKRCCSVASKTNNNATSMDTNTHHSRPSVLRTHFFLHTTPSGAPVDLFKPMVDTSNCFCTQHTIYS